MPKYLPTILLIIALALIPLAVYVERAEPKVWNNRLFAPSFKNEPNLHTPIHAAGTFLPPVIGEDTTFTAAANPILLTSTTRIEPGATVTLTAGAHLFAHEWGTLDVLGNLNIQGTQEQPVVLTTNEQHEHNKVWSGLFFQSGSSGTIDYAVFEHAAPAISCLQNSGVAYNHIRITRTPTEIYSENNTCPAYVRTF